MHSPLPLFSRSTFKLILWLLFDSLKVMTQQVTDTTKWSNYIVSLFCSLFFECEKRQQLKEQKTFLRRLVHLYFFSSLGFKIFVISFNGISLLFSIFIPCYFEIMFIMLAQASLQMNNRQREKKKINFIRRIIKPSRYEALFFVSSFSFYLLFVM